MTDITLAEQIAWQLATCDAATFCATHSAFSDSDTRELDMAAASMAGAILASLERLQGLDDSKNNPPECWARFKGGSFIRSHFDDEVRLRVQHFGPTPKKVAVVFDNGEERWFDPNETVNAMLEIHAKALKRAERIEQAARETLESLQSGELYERTALIERLAEALNDE